MNSIESINCTESIKQVVKNYIEEKFIGEHNSTIEDDTSLIEGQIIDSSGVLELIMFIEGAFKMEFLDEELIPENFNDLNAIEKIITQKQTNMN